jgi:hypothetical protein
MEHFPPAGNLQLDYGTVPLAPFMWVDDMLNATGDVEKARQVNNKVDTLMKQRGLTLNEDKSVCIILGSKKQKEDASIRLEINPLICGNFITRDKQEDKWLGQIISSGGLADSVCKTVGSRESKIKAACLEIVVIMNDWRSRIVGGFETALLLWEACCIPSLLHGAGTWVSMSQKTEKNLNAIQHWFLRLAFQVGPGAPLASLLFETEMLDMGLRVWREKLMLALHLKSLEESTLARQIFEEQLDQKWPGLASEVEEICKELDIENVNSTRLEKKVFRKIVTAACHRKNEGRLRKSAEGKVKCRRMMSEEYGKKKYLGQKSLSSVRSQFRTRFGLQPFAGNYSHDRRFARSQWLCKCEVSVESESHLLEGSCPVYGEINLRYTDLNDEEQLINFFNEVLAKREMIEDQN